MSYSAQDAESWKHWMAPTLMMKNSISAAMISRSLNNDAPGGNTASCVTWKIKRKIITTNGHTLSFETINKTNEIFERIEEYLPKRISMPFVAYKILSNVVQSAEEKYVLNYSLLQVPQKAMAKHTCNWNDMLRQFDA